MQVFVICLVWNWNHCVSLCRWLRERGDRELTADSALNFCIAHLKACEHKHSSEFTLYNYKNILTWVHVSLFMFHWYRSSRACSALEWTKKATEHIILNVSYSLLILNTPANHTKHLEEHIEEVKYVLMSACQIFCLCVQSNADCSRTAVDFLASQC